MTETDRNRIDRNGIEFHPNCGNISNCIEFCRFLSDHVELYRGFSEQVMNDQRLALYQARDSVIDQDKDGLRELALEYSAKTCTEIVQG